PSITLPYLEYLDPIMEVKLSSRVPKHLLVPKTTEILNHLEVFLRNKAMEKTYFQTTELATHIGKTIKKDKYICEGIAQIIFQSMQRYGKLSGNMNSNNIAKSHETRGYMVLPGYQDFLKFITNTLDRYLNNPNLTWDVKSNEG